MMLDHWWFFSKPHAHVFLLLLLSARLERSHSEHRFVDFCSFVDVISPRKFRLILRSPLLAVAQAQDK